MRVIQWRFSKEDRANLLEEISESSLLLKAFRKSYRRLSHVVRMAIFELWVRSITRGSYVVRPRWKAALAVLGATAGALRHPRRALYSQEEDE